MFYSNHKKTWPGGGLPDGGAFGMDQNRASSPAAMVPAVVPMSGLLIIWDGPLVASQSGFTCCGMSGNCADGTFPSMSRDAMPPPVPFCERGI